MATINYWRGRTAGYWQYKVRPRLSIQYLRGYLAAWWQK